MSSFVIIVLCGIIVIPLLLTAWLLWIAGCLLLKLMVFEESPTLNEQRAAAAKERKTKIEITEDDDDEEDWE